MLTIMYIISGLGMMLLPIALGIFLARKFKLSWRLFFAGAITFVLSQVLHIPLLLWMTSAFKNGTLPNIPSGWTLLFNAVVLGMLAGIFEETARYILFKYVLKSARSWNEGVFVGAGHGGIEALLAGISVLGSLIFMSMYQSVDLATVASVPAEQLELARQQVTAFWSVPVYVPLLGVLERVSALSLHATLSVMVLYSIVARKPIWFWLALLWHATVDGVAVYLGQMIGLIALEAIVGVMAVLSLLLLFNLRKRFPSAETANAEG